MFNNYKNNIPTNLANVLSAEDNTVLNPCFNGSIFLSIFKSLKVLLKKKNLVYVLIEFLFFFFLII